MSEHTITEGLRAVQRAEQVEDKMAAYRALARATVDLRVAHGAISGRAFTYRTALTNAYKAAGVSGAERRKITAAIRYHVGAILRERGLVDETDGYLPESPRERSLARKREAH